MSIHVQCGVLHWSLLQRHHGMRVDVRSVLPECMFVSCHILPTAYRDSRADLLVIRGYARAVEFTVGGDSKGIKRKELLVLCYPGASPSAVQHHTSLAGPRVRSRVVQCCDFFLRTCAVSTVVANLSANKQHCFANNGRRCVVVFGGFFAAPFFGGRGQTDAVMLNFRCAEGFRFQQGLEAGGGQF